MRDRIAGLFARRHDDSEELVRTDSHETAVAEPPSPSSPEIVADEIDEVSEPTATVGPDTEQGLEPAPNAGPDIVWLDTTEPVEAPRLASDVPPPSSTEQPPTAVAPPQDFKFPWTRPEIDVSSSQESDSATELSPQPELVEAFPPLEAPEKAAAGEKRPGFFARLFRRQQKQIEPEPKEVEPVFGLQDEQIVDASHAAEAVVDEAPPPVADELTWVPTTEPRADAITGVPEDAFTSVRDVESPASTPEDAFTSVPDVDAPASVPEDAFTSVDDALPVSDDLVPADDAVVDFQDAGVDIGEDLEPPAPKPGFFARLFGRGAKEEEPKRLSVEVYQDRIEAAANALDTAGESAFTPGEDTLPAADNAFESVEEALPSGVDLFADTLEPIEPPVPTSSRDTLEVEEKTDEFEIIPAPPIEEVEPPAIEPSEVPGDETISLEKKSFWRESFIKGLFRRGDTEVEKVGAAEEQAAEGSAVFLLAKFRAFYNEIIRFKHQKSEFAAGFATAIVTDYGTDQSPDASAESLSKRLTELLELQAAEAKWMGGEAGDRYPDAQYAMAALADETFAHLQWEGQTAWPKYSIENKLYQTNAADVDVFKRMDKLLKGAPDSAVGRDLARVYLLVIAAGFRGKYRPFGLTRALAEYRRRLYEYIHNDDALMLYAPERRIFPEAASQTLAGHAVRRFSAAQRWAAILIFLVVSYTVIAHVAWSRVSADLKDVTARIKSGSNAAGAR